MRSATTLEQAVEVFAAIHFLIMGLSHVLRPREWARFFADLRGRGTTGALLNGMLSLGMGSVIAAFHNTRGLACYRARRTRTEAAVRERVRGLPSAGAAILAPASQEAPLIRGHATGARVSATG